MINLLKPRIFALLASTIVLSGCQNPATDILDILAPVGAPSLALYSYATDSHFVTNASVPVIKAAFFDETTDIIIVDHQQGLKQITEQNADFSLARIITKGNLHLVGLNKAADTIPTSADHIISFGAASAVVKEVLFHLYPDIAPIVTFVASLSDIAPIMTLGQYNQTAVDFVLVAEPLLSKVVSNSNGDIIYINHKLIYKLLGMMQPPLMAIRKQVYLSATQLMRQNLNLLKNFSLKLIKILPILFLIQLR